MLRLMLFILLISFTSSLYAVSLQDPTHRPMKMIMKQETLQKKYPIDLVIIGSNNKVLKVGNKSYTIGSEVDGMRIVDIQVDKVILQDGRHGYVTLQVKH